jgi:hypothetical protein
MVSVKTSKKGLKKALRYDRIGLSPWFHELTMYSLAVGSISRMRAGNSDLNIVPTTKWECVGGPLFWDNASCN